jgi:hypothetical protein
LLYLPVLEWKLEEALDGVFFEDQNDQTGVSVIPVEESCRRYLPETIEQ